MSSLLAVAQGAKEEPCTNPERDPYKDQSRNKHATAVMYFWTVTFDAGRLSMQSNHSAGGRDLILDVPGAEQLEQFLLTAALHEAVTSQF